jgi:hypothetical protein
MDSNKTIDNMDIIEETVSSVELDRRTALKRMMLGAISVAATSSLTACLGDGTPQSLTFNPSSVGGSTPTSGDLGSFENPLTQENPGDFSSGKALRQVGVFSSQVNASTSTPIHGIWVEVMDVDSAAPMIDGSNASAAISDFAAFSADESRHPMSASEFVAEIRITNADTGSVLAAGTFAAGEEPRVIFETSLTGITRINAYARIDGAGGWWMDTYDVSDLTYKHPNSTTGSAAGENVHGSPRQPLTRNQSGKHNGAQGKIFGHTGSGKAKTATVGDAGEQILRIQFSDHDQTRKHPGWTATHYFVGGLLLDQRGQPIDGATYTWGSGETGTISNGIISQLKSTVTAWQNPSTAGSSVNYTDINGNTVTVAPGEYANGAAATGTSGTPSTTNSAVMLDIALPDYVTEYRLIWLCNPDGWWHIRGNTALIAG